MLHKSHKYWLWCEIAVHVPKNTLVACLDIIHLSLQAVLVWQAFHSRMVPNYCRLCIHLNPIHEDFRLLRQCDYKVFHYHDLAAGWVMHICISKLNIIGSSHYLNQCSNIDLTLRNTFWWNVNRNSCIFLKKMHFKILSGKWHPSCLGINELRHIIHNCYIIFFV